jgi:hypothetical protein
MSAVPLANGLSTDHPIPDLPFVDDTHLPVDDPADFEAVGRGAGEGMWGRYDRTRDGGWVAFTTDPLRHELGWVVRYRPGVGRSVTLYRDEDTSEVHVCLDSDALLYRSGGYWWDGSTWYRPTQIYDRGSGDWTRRPVPAATTVTAAELLRGGGRAEHGQVLAVADIDPQASPALRPRTAWLDDLAVWDRRNADRERPGQSVVLLSAPELAADQLIGVPELAELADVAPPTLRSYLSRGQSELPQPQAVIAGRNLWARTVGEEWIEQRRRSPDGLTEAVAGPMPNQPIGQSQLQVWFTRTFFYRLWEAPNARRRWALKSRNEQAVRQVATELGWEVSASLGKIIPLDHLSVTLEYALLRELAHDHDSIHNRDVPFYGVSRPIAVLLGWLIRHAPDHAENVIGEVVRAAAGDEGIPRAVTEETIRHAVQLDGGLDHAIATDFLDRVLEPQAAG